MNRSPLRRDFILIVVAFAYLGLSPASWAVVPPPDGAYFGFNTAEGGGALFSLTNGLANTALGYKALYHNIAGYSNTATGSNALQENGGSYNTATGADALINNKGGIDNTAVGFQALFNNTESVVGPFSFVGAFNTAIGSRALYTNPFGQFNTAVGFQALYSNFPAFSMNNTAIGSSTLFNHTGGTGNIAVGFNAGSNLTVGNNNIYIYDPGLSAESNTIRIGSQGTQTATFIAGITGVSEGSPTAVFINTSTGQLGTTAPTSSRRFKKEIKPMDKVSEGILAFKPVTFKYKSDDKGTPQFGLIAEEVAKVSPDVVVYGPDGKPYSVRYDAVNAMLLNEFLKEHRTVQEQQKEIDALKAQLKEQRALIQKVSDKVELNEPAPQTVLNQ